MNGTFKKTVSAFAVLSMAAAYAVMPVSAASSISIDGASAVVTPDKDAYVYVASYTDGRLTGVTKTDAKANEAATVAVKEGDKVMLWDAADGMTPLADAVVVTAPTEAPTEAPTDAPDEGVIKFDFGSADTVADGYYSVTADTVYATNKGGDLQYGLHGTDGNGNKVTSRTDGIAMQEGQNIVLNAGAKAAVASAEDDYLGLADGQYPLRFAMKSETNKYYKVKATLTTADQAKDATVSLYSEKRYPIIENETVKAGENKVVEYYATVQDVYYEKSEPKGRYNDDQLNVVVLGDNAALAALEVTPVEHVPTVWVYTDSTGCAYDAILPFYGLQNYGGVGQWLTKYLPYGWTMSNQGEGGLNAADNLHWNTSNANIQAGDVVYVEYGHNHKTDGPEGYLKNIPKYYEKAHSVGAYTVYVGPCDRHNESQYDAATNTWSSTLKGFSDAASKYVDELIAGGATDVAFVDVNEPSLRWMEEVCEDVKAKRGAEAYERNATDYYFQGRKGGGIDGTHPNDAGADNLAYRFFTDAKARIAAAEAADATASQKVQAEVLKKLTDGMQSATPYVVPKEVVDAGKAPNSAYPDVYLPPNLAQYPVMIKNVEFVDGVLTKVDVTVQAAEFAMEAYGIIEVTIYGEDGTEKGKLYAKDQVDNSTGYGPQTILNFKGDTVLAEGDTYTAQVWKAVDSGENGLIVDPSNTVYSALYKPTNVKTVLVTDEDGNTGEDFDYYGTSAGEEITGKNGWSFIGSAGHDVTLGKDEAAGFNYVRVMSDGMKNGNANQGSFYLYKSLNSMIGTKGKYQVKMDLNYSSGTDYNGAGMYVNFADGSNKTNGGSQNVNLFKINAGGKLVIGDTEVGALSQNQWITVDYTLDMDNATAYLSVAGGDPVAVEVPNYAVNFDTVKPTQAGFINFDINRGTIDMKLANLEINELKQDKLADKTLTVKSGDEKMGAVAISDTDQLSITAERNTVKTITAEAQAGYEFVQWTDAQGETFSYAPSIEVRMFDDLELTAEFKAAVFDPITYMFKESFSTLTTDSLAASGWKSPNAQGNMTVENDPTDGIGNYMRFGANSNSRGAAKAFDEKYLASASTENKIAYQMDIRFNAANTDPNEFALHSGNIVYNSNNINYGCTGGYVLFFKQANNGAVTVNDAATDIPNNTWAHVSAVLDYTTHKADVTVTSLDGAASYYSGTVDMADTTADGIAGVYYKFGRTSGGAVSVDNFKIFTAEQLSLQ